MAYVPRDESPGYHHVVARGNNKRCIYDDDRDRVFFSLHVSRVARKHGWRVLAYCLMENHYHLLLHVGDEGLARGMCELNTGYAVHYNRTHGRVNHLFGKRYWNRRITNNASLLSTVRYIVQNPRRAGGSRPLDAYRWSSYSATVGLSLAAIDLAKDELLALFGRTPARAVEAFREFCRWSSVGAPRRWQPP